MMGCDLPSTVFELKQVKGCKGAHIYLYGVRVKFTPKLPEGGHLYLWEK